MAKQELKKKDSQTPVDREVSPGEFLRHGPFTLLRRMNEEMARVFGELAGDRSEEGRTAFAPPVDVREADGKYEIRAELPGLNAEDVKLTITEHAVAIEGERETERKEERSGVHIAERRYGRFYRAIPLPDGAKTGEATARFNNGVLEIDIPLEPPQTKARQIPIESGQGNQPGTQQPPQGGSNKAA
jgi:HSP20 family protein